jgi:hypothetical protein
MGWAKFGRFFHELIWSPFLSIMLLLFKMVVLSIKVSNKHEHLLHIFMAGLPDFLGPNIPNWEKHTK